VREYWVIEPDKKFVQVHLYEKGHYFTSEYKGAAVISSAVLQGFSIELKTLWAAMEDVAPPA